MAWDQEPDDLWCKYVGQQVTVTREEYVSGRVCHHHDGGWCVQPGDTTDCYPLQLGDKVKIIDSPEVRKIADMIRATTDWGVGELMSLEIARKIMAEDY